MNWTQKLKAIQAIGRYNEVSLRMRDDYSWYVASVEVDRKEGNVLSSGLQKGNNPEEAVEQWWDWATDLKFYLVTRQSGKDRRAFKWNGFMWQDVEESV